MERQNDSLYPHFYEKKIANKSINPTFESKQVKQEFTQNNKKKQ